MAGDMRYTIADVPGLIPGASQGKGLGLEFLRHIERTEIIAHVIDCATLEPDRDPMSDYKALEHELAEYADKLELPLGAIPIPERPRIIILNKVDMPEAKELAEFVKPEFEKLGLNVYVISTASHEGLKELNWALAAMVADMRKEVAEREQAEEEARVVIKPLEEPRNRRRRNDEGGTALDFTVERKEAGNGDVWYEVLGTKPERWVMQTNFDNDEAVGYLADRLAKLGVEDELRNKGANLATKYASARAREPWNSIGIRPLLRARKCSTAPSLAHEASTCDCRNRTAVRSAAPTRNAVASTTK